MGRRGTGSGVFFFEVLPDEASLSSPRVELQSVKGEENEDGGGVKEWSGVEWKGLEEWKGVEEWRGVEEHGEGKEEVGLRR
mmetsp:Transcript_6904/g.9347  ORF Transcript_6904/g.9347 Transcript_6904/m.9347 type:complete len:81 (-) Transcript_6904:389-631(-)